MYTHYRIGFSFAVNALHDEHKAASFRGVSGLIQVSACVILAGGLCSRQATSGYCDDLCRVDSSHIQCCN